MNEAAASSGIVVHEIEEVDLRGVFQREDRAFTPWLSRPENLNRLARALGFDMELVATEASSGTFRTDIVASRLTDGATVVIENQFGRSDHDHFGKALTYLAAHGAKVVVWIAEAFADEHRAALAWLNDNTPEEVGFYAVAPRLMRIAGSPPGLRFEVVAAPNRFVKKAKREERGAVDEVVGAFRSTLWTALAEAVAADQRFADCRLRYGGRLSFAWLLPALAAEWREDEPRVLVWLGRSATGQQGTGLDLRCREGARPEAEVLTRRAAEALRVRGVPTGVSSADLSSDTAVRSAVADLLGRGLAACEELRRAFG